MSGSSKACGRKATRRARRAKAFTLVELLVVVAIIMALLATLLPALNMARQKAKELQCMCNLRQIGIATASYANDYKMWLPPYYVNYAYAYRWTGYGATHEESCTRERAYEIWKKLYPSYLSNPRVFFCAFGPFSYQTHFQYNSNSRSSYVYIMRYPPYNADLPKPRTILQNNCPVSSYYQYTNYPIVQDLTGWEAGGAGTFNHSGKAGNYLYVDGRVRWLLIRNGQYIGYGNCH